MKIFRFLLALLLASPAAAQIRVIPPLPAPSFVSPPVAALSAPLLPAAALPARTVLGLRDDADRLYAALAAIHSRDKVGEASPALAGLKRALIADFDGVIARLPPAALAADETPAARVKALRRERAQAERNSTPARLASVTGELAAMQLRAGRDMLAADSPIGPRAFKRNAALWSLVGAHNSAAASAAEAARLEAFAQGEAAFGDGRPFIVWNRWSNMHAQLEQAARHARNGRPAEARRLLRSAAAILRRSGHDAADLNAAAAFAALARQPDSATILAAKNLVAHPDVKTRTAIAYGEFNSARRAQVHALESARADYLETLDHETSLRLAEALLSSPRPSTADKARARVFLTSAAEWAGRGRIEAKRLAARNLLSAVAALDRGDRKLAARHAGWAVDTLVERRAELSRIALSMRRRQLGGLSS